MVVVAVKRTVRGNHKEASSDSDNSVGSIFTLSVDGLSMLLSVWWGNYGGIGVFGKNERTGGGPSPKWTFHAYFQTASEVTVAL